MKKRRSKSSFKQRSYIFAKTRNGNISSTAGSAIALTNNEMKYMMKVIMSLENRTILLKGITEKVINQNYSVTFLIQSRNFVYHQCKIFL